MRQVLFLVYSFPPAGGAGVQRSLKFAKYLPQFGWQPVVVTATPNTYPVRDTALLEDVPAGTPLYRVPGCDVNALRPRMARYKLEKVITAGNVLLLLPDAALFWARLARRAVRRAVQEHRPSLIYSSSPPASAHLLGLWTQHAFRMPWLIDYRDPWTQNPLTPYLPGYRALNRRMERQVLAHADRAVTVSGPLAGKLAPLAGRGDSFVTVIENGYDQDDVPVLPPPHTDRFTITYTGTFSRLRRPDAFVAAVDDLVRTGQVPLEELRVVVAGKDTAAYLPDRPPFEQPGYLSHDQLADLRRQSDLLLLIVDPSPQSRGTFTGKVFEYLACNRPTLAIADPENVAAQLIERARAGRVVRHAPAEVAEGLLYYYRFWKSGRFEHAPDWDLIHQYTRRNLTARLATEFDRLVPADENG